MKTLLSILLHNGALRPKISSPNQQRLLLSSASALALLLSGCSGSGGDDIDTVPGYMTDYQIKIVTTESKKVELQLLANDNSHTMYFGLEPSQTKSLQIDFEGTQYLEIKNPPIDNNASYQQIIITGGPDSNMLFSADNQESDEIMITIENGVNISAPESHHLYQLFGNATNNVFEGGVSDDLLTGVGGDDNLYGEEGDDHLYGDEGDDYLYGGEGDDNLYGGEGDDKLYGDAGDDNLHGGEGDDNLYGDEGDDNLYGDEGDDKLYGDAGDDWLDGGLGENVLDGGPGIDTAGFPGTLNDYTIDKVVGSDSYLVTQNEASSNSPNSSDTLSKIEILEFSDRTCILPNVPEWLYDYYSECL